MDIQEEGGNGGDGVLAVAGVTGVVGVVVADELIVIESTGVLGTGGATVGEDEDEDENEDERENEHEEGAGVVGAEREIMLSTS